jgi:hypothetical protein
MIYLAYDVHTVISIDLPIKAMSRRPLTHVVSLLHKERTSDTVQELKTLKFRLNQT